MDKKTGAKIGENVVTLSLILLHGTFGVFLAESQNGGNSTQKVGMGTISSNPADILKGMIIDLKKSGAQNVKYYDSVVIATLPHEYIYINDEGWTFTSFDGTVPNGYFLTTLQSGEKVCAKKILPKKITLGPAITYNLDKNGVQTFETITWDEEKSKVNKYILTISVSGDVITFCNRNNISFDSFIYVENPQDEIEQSKPVRYSEEDAESSEVYEQGGREYVLNRKVVFYTDKEDSKKLANRFAGHLTHGEIMVFDKVENGKVIFLIYKQAVKKLSKVLCQVVLVEPKTNDK